MSYEEVRQELRAAFDRAKQGNALRWKSTSPADDSVVVAFFGPQDSPYVAVRQGNKDEPVFLFTHEEWLAFVAGVEMGEFDLDGELGPEAA